MADRIVSIVVPCRNGEATLPACLESLTALERPEGCSEVEIIVVDNNSTDLTASIAAEAGVNVLPCERRGADAARNVGFAAARGDIIACTDADCTVEPDWLRRLVSTLDAHPAVGVVGSAVVAGRSETLAEQHCARRSVLDPEVFARGLPGFLPFIVTAGAAFRRRALDETGAFHEGMFPSEDADLCWRMQWAGWRLAFEPRARVNHFHRASLRSYWRQTFEYGRATARLFARHRHRLGRRVWLGFTFAGDVRRALQRIPGALLFGKTKYERLEPILDVLIRSADFSGRLVGSLQSGVLVF